MPLLPAKFRLQAMFQKKKIAILFALMAFVIIGVAAVKYPYRKERNLKVLPLDISDEKLDSIMKTYNVALGVECKFCHVPEIGFPDSLNYASDKEPMKENARGMMRMVIDINSRYFYYDQQKRPEYLNTITCNNCHQGHPLPPGFH
ncbi:MAG: c-type cytochrome [Chitinophagaceae bacterium]